MTDKSEFRIYKFNGNLVSYDSRERNIDGWYSDYNKALKDLVRASSYEGGQFVLVDKSHSPYTENGFICALAVAGRSYIFSHVCDY